MSFNGVSRLSFVFPLRGLAKKKKLTAQRIVGMNGRRIVGGTNNFVPLTPYYYYMTASAHFPKNCTPNAAATSCILPARRSSYCFSSSSCNRKRVQPCHVEAFKSMGLMTRENDDLASYNRDYLGEYQGMARVAVLPKSKEEVAKVVRYCYSNDLSVVPQGGNTGLVGGSVAMSESSVVVSMSKMNAIEHFDNISGVLVCQAGCILEELERFVEGHGFTMPLDLGSKGSCQIGGNVATNAGGLRFMRYGPLRSTVLGLEVVLGTGEVLNVMSTHPKDNTGFDLKGLMIGSEGLLGIITRVVIQTQRLPQFVDVCLVQCQNFDSVIKTYSLARKVLGEIISGVELVDGEAMAFTQKAFPSLPRQEACPYSILLEVSSTAAEARTRDRLESFLEECSNSRCITGGTVAVGKPQSNALWSIREHVPNAGNQTPGHSYKFDISISLENFPVLLEAVKNEAKALGMNITVLGYGNIHINLPGMKEDMVSTVKERLEPFVYEWVVKHGGSISAEHGIGLSKKRFLSIQKQPLAINSMWRIKRIFDPKGIMNPGKVIDMHEPAAGAVGL